MAQPFELHGLSQDDEGFTLSFAAEGDSDVVGTVFVSFAGDEVVGAVLVD